MTWGLVAVAGATLVSGAIGSKSSKDATKAQAQAADAGIASQERMFDKSLELQQPYRDAGYQALGGLQDLTDPNFRSNALQGYYAGPEYSQLANQSAQDVARYQGATGGLRGGGTQGLMAGIAPQLGQSYLSNLNQQYTGLANLGMGAASQGAQGAIGLGQGISNLQQQQGQAAAQNSLAQGNIWGNVASDLGGLGYQYLNKGNI